MSRPMFTLRADRFMSLAIRLPSSGKNSFMITPSTPSISRLYTLRITSVGSRFTCSSYFRMYGVYFSPCVVFVR